jgi:hypothetical protein
MYAEAFERAQDDYYVGINAAKSVFLNTAEDKETADDYAAQVHKFVGVDCESLNSYPARCAFTNINWLVRTCYERPVCDCQSR